MGKLFHKSVHTRGSRLEPVRLFQDLWIKRDDELGWLGMGSKVRKLRLFTEFIVAEGLGHVVTEGSGASNHLVASALWFRAHGIPFTFLRRESHHDGPTPHLKLLDLFLNDTQVLNRAGWLGRDRLVRQIVEEQARQGKPSVYLPEGGMHPACARAGVEIAREIMDEMDTVERVIIDAGTGLTALGLAHELRRRRFRGQVVIVQVAGTPRGLEALWEEKVSLWLGGERAFPRCQVLAPLRSFGRVPRHVRDLSRQFTEATGILVDPLYLGSFLERGLLASQGVSTVVLHSGGSLNSLNYP